MMSFPRTKELMREVVRRRAGERDFRVEGVDSGILIRGEVRKLGIVTR